MARSFRVLVSASRNIGRFMKRRSEGRFKNLSPGAYKSWDMVSVGIRRRNGEKETKTTVLSRNFTRQTVPFFFSLPPPPLPSYKRAARLWRRGSVFPWSGGGEMITTPNRLREEILGVCAVRSSCVWRGASVCACRARSS